MQDKIKKDSIKIRRFREEDAPVLSSVIKDCFLSLDIGRHTEEGIQLQIQHNSPENLIKKAKEIKYFVLEIDCRAIGICGYDSQKVHTLFVSPKYKGKGYGKLLLQKVLSGAKKEGLKTILTWSTCLAVNFYRSFGFTVKREIALPEGKREIILVEMEKTL